MSSDLKKLGILGVGLGLLGSLALHRQHKHKKDNAPRLPTCLRPTHYDLTVTPDLRTEEDGGTHSFDGLVEVQLEVLEDGVTEVKFNSAELDLLSATVAQGDAAPQEGRIEYNVKRETATVHLGRALAKGVPARLAVRYKGVLNDKMAGFYRSRYTSARDGKTRLMGTTQFESCDARRALPCWDEPAVKATFGVTLVVPEGLQALSNMEETGRQPAGPGLVRLTFAKTPKMSTYLLAFVVGEFDVVQGRTTEGVEVRVFTPVGKADQGRFGLDVAVRSLSFYTSYFEMGYPLRKLDMVAIPDFAAGAMENWGLVTYRETALLYDPASSSQTSKQWVALVVAHELAHQWFGNIVTMEFWTQLWLNEGFATWVEYLAVNHLFPEWQIWTQFVSLDLGRALNLDSLLNSHPVEVEVKYAHEVDEIFDAISYSKGSCVIRMLVAYLGEEAFRRGMALYLRRYAYDNAETVDLWNALEESSGQPVASVMGTWTLQTGFPVVTVSRRGPREIEVRQNRFLASGPAPPSEDDRTWGIPLQAVVGTADAGAPALLVKQLVQERTASVPLPEGTRWIKLNAGQNGLYRVIYPDDLLDELLGAVRRKDPRVSASDRLGLQDDAFALTRAGLMRMGRLLDVVDAFGGEDEYTVWNDLSANLSRLASLLMHTDQYERFGRWGASLYARVAARVGWDKAAGEDALTTMLRSTVIGMLCRFRHEPTVAEALARFDRFVAANASGASEAEQSKVLAPDLRGTVYGVAVGHRGRPAHQAVLGIYGRTDLNEEKVRCLAALGAAADVELLRETLDFGFDAKKVRPQDLMYVLGTVQANRNGSAMAWQYLKDNWAATVERHGGSFIISRIVSGLAASFATNEAAADIEAFFKKAPAPGAERAVQQTLEKIRGSAAWLQRDLAEIRAFLDRRG